MHGLRSKSPFHSRLSHQAKAVKLQGVRLQSLYVGGKNACTAHVINQKALIAVVLTDIRSKAILAQRNREALKERILAMKKTSNEEKASLLKAELTAIEKRLAELEKLIQAAYEDKVMGRIPEGVCINLLNKYESERAEKLEHKKEISTKLRQVKRTKSPSMTGSI